MSIPFEANERLLSFDRAPLFWRKHLPQNPKAHVLIVHGYSEHGGRYAHVAEFLAGRGYGTWAMDNRGHGRSAGKRGHVDRYDDYVRDLAQFYDLVRKEAGGKKIFLFGHSNGGLISLRFALTHPDEIAALALSDPLLELAKPIAPLKLFAGRVLARVAPTFTMANELQPAELMQDPAMVEAYLADPLIFHQTTPGWFVEMEKASADAAARARELKMPFLLLLGGADPVCATSASKRFFEACGSADKELHVYEGLRHEIVNELPEERRKVFDDLGNWLDKHV